MTAVSEDRNDVGGMPLLGAQEPLPAPVDEVMASGCGEASAAREREPAAATQVAQVEPVRIGAALGALVAIALLAAAFVDGASWWTGVALVAYVAPALILLGMALAGRMRRLCSHPRLAARPPSPAAEHGRATSSLERCERPATAATPPSLRSASGSGRLVGGAELDRAGSIVFPPLVTVVPPDGVDPA